MPHQTLTDSLYYHVTSPSYIPHLYQYSVMRGHPSAHLHFLAWAWTPADTRPHLLFTPHLPRDSSTTARTADDCRLLWKQPAASKRPISDLNPQHCQKQASGLHAVIRHDVVCYDKIWTLTQSQARLPKSERINSINNNVESQVEENIRVFNTWLTTILLHS